MGSRIRILTIALVAIAIIAPGASAQIEDEISVYTGDNVENYLNPLAEAFGACLNNGLFYSARIPTAGIRVSLEFPIMGVMFGDGDRTFTPAVESGFTPAEPVPSVSTIVGPGDYTPQAGQGGTQFLYPGGLNLNSFAIAVPQLRVGSVMGTEAIIRFISFDLSDSSELGKLTLFGFGARHSISQYAELPVDVSAGFMYQTFKVGENADGGDLISTSAFSLGVQASKAFGVGVAFEPYTGLSWDSFSMDVSYENISNEVKEISFDRTNTIRWTAGLGVNLIFAHAFAQYDFASRSSFSMGLVLGNVGVGI